jgi:hypothetical protein
VAIALAAGSLGGTPMAATLATAAAMEAAQGHNVINTERIRRHSLMAIPTPPLFARRKPGNTRVEKQYSSTI